MNENHRSFLLSFAFLIICFLDALFVEYLYRKLSLRHSYQYQAEIVLPKLRFYNIKIFMQRVARELTFCIHLFIIKYTDLPFHLINQQSFSCLLAHFLGCRHPALCAPIHDKTIVAYNGRVPIYIVVQPIFKTLLIFSCNHMHNDVTKLQKSHVQMTFTHLIKLIYTTKQRCK